MQQNENFAKHAEQAEAERPEVVAYRTIGRHGKHQHPHCALNYYKQNAEDQAAHWRERGCEVSEDELMTVAQHERIVGALRTENAKLSEALDECDGDRWKLRSERDAALAEVAGLRSLLNSLLCYVERDINRMRSDRDKSDNKEIYDRSISLAMERLKAAQNAVFTTEPGCDTAVELAAQTTQAQHSVPEASEKEKEQGWTLDYRFVERVTELAASQTEYTTSMEATEQVLLAALELLAAAPGKEGV